MFDNYNKTKLEELRSENELFYELAIDVLSNKNSAITPFSVKEVMIELEILCQNEDIKEILENDNREHAAFIRLQTGDVSDSDLNKLVLMGLLDPSKIKEDNPGETKMFPKTALDLKAPVISIKDKELEEKLAVYVKSGIYSKLEVQKMIDNDLVDKEKLMKYYHIYGIERERDKKLANAFKPIMSFDGVRLSNDLVIGGANESPQKADEMANKQIYIF